MNKSFLCLLFMLLVLSLHANPFTQKRKVSEQKTSQVEQKQLLKPNGKLVKTQKNVYRKMMSLVRDLKQDRKSLTLLILLGFSFAYGFLHALGPGHGKLFTASYLLHSEHKIITGIGLGMGSGIIHSLSGFILVFFFHFIMQVSGQNMATKFSEYAPLLSYSIVLLVGLFLAFRIVLGKHHHQERKTFWGIILSVGLVPCPVVVLVSTFSVLHQIQIIGIMMISCMAIGMGTAISLTNLLILFAKKTLLFGIQTQSNLLLEKILPLVGALLLIFLGGFLLYSHIQYL